MNPLVDGTSIADLISHVIGIPHAIFVPFSCHTQCLQKFALQFDITFPGKIPGKFLQNIYARYFISTLSNIISDLRIKSINKIENIETRDFMRGYWIWVKVCLQ